LNKALIAYIFNNKGLTIDSIVKPFVLSFAIILGSSDYNAVIFWINNGITVPAFSAKVISTMALGVGFGFISMILAPLSFANSASPAAG
jgi:hypothetical protein